MPWVCWAQGLHELTIAWSPPEDDGGDEIFEFELQWSQEARRRRPPALASLPLPPHGQCGGSAAAVCGAPRGQTCFWDEKRGELFDGWLPFTTVHVGPCRFRTKRFANLRKDHVFHFRVRWAPPPRAAVALAT